MATKNTGIGDNYYVSGYDLSGATNALSKITGTVAQIDVTDITQSGHARLNGLRDGLIDWVSLFDVSASGAHALLSTLPTSDVIATYFRGTAVGNPAASLVAKQINYDPTRTNTGQLEFAVNAVGQGFGLEWGTQLTAGLRTDTTATTGAFFDLNSVYGTGIFPLSFGAQAYFQLIAFSGTSVTIDIQAATTSGGSYTTTGLTTTAMTAIGAQRLVVSNTTTVNRFLKVVTTGTFSNAVFAVMINPNQTASTVF